MNTTYHVMVAHWLFGGTVLTIAALQTHVLQGGINTSHVRCPALHCAVDVLCRWLSVPAALVRAAANNDLSMEMFEADGLADT